MHMCVLKTEYMPHKEDMHSDLFVARCVYPYLSVDISDGREVTLCDFISGTFEFWLIFSRSQSRVCRCVYALDSMVHLRLDVALVVLSE